MNPGAAQSPRASGASTKIVVDSGGIDQVEMIQLSSRGPGQAPFGLHSGLRGQRRDKVGHFDLARWIVDLAPVVVGGQTPRPRVLPATSGAALVLCQLRAWPLGLPVGVAAQRLARRVRHPRPRPACTRPTQIG
jgi:hypothetical protein